METNFLAAPPVFLVRPADVTLPQPQPSRPAPTAKLDCVAAGNPTPAIFWMKEGGGSGVLLPGSVEDRVKVALEGTLIIEGVTKRDAGFYSCAAVSESGSTLARAEIRFSSPADRPPPIINLGPANQTLAAGKSARMPCEAEEASSINGGGGSGLTVTWLKDGVPLTTMTALDDRVDVAGDNTLTIRGKQD